MKLTNQSSAANVRMVILSLALIALLGFPIAAAGRGSPSKSAPTVTAEESVAPADGSTADLSANALVGSSPMLSRPVIPSPPIIPDPMPEYVPGHLLIKLSLKTNAEEEQKRNLRAITDRLSESCELRDARRLFPAVQDLPLVAFHLLAFDPSCDIPSLVKIAEGMPEVAYAEPNYLMQVSRTPNDPSYNLQWHLNNVGQTGGTADADVDAPEAWDMETGRSEVVIAILDNGFDMVHEDLRDKFWRNPGETGLDAMGRSKESNGVDDDTNGYVDDFIGWDFWGRTFGLDQDNNPTDDTLPGTDAHGHGTHVAGIAAASTNNARGVSGASWNSKIMALRIGSGRDISTDLASSAAVYAAQNGARIISMSFGGTGSSQTFHEVLVWAHNYGVLLIAAAGNDGIATNNVWPSSLREVVSVIATDHNDVRAPFSNYGWQSEDNADICAPGADILSTFPGNLYQPLSGTSMATPLVSGIAALVYSRGLSTGRDLTNNEVRCILRNTADDRGAPGFDLEYGFGRVNAQRAVANFNTVCDLPICGDGELDPLLHSREECDDGKQCSDGTLCTRREDCAGIGDEFCQPRGGDGCGTSCTFEVCGNNILDVGEECDTGKYCEGITDWQCGSDSVCRGIGDGLCMPRDGDDDYCSSTCQIEECGDGIIQPNNGEQCDDGKECADGRTCTLDAQCAGIGDSRCLTRYGGGCTAACLIADSNDCGPVDLMHVIDRSGSIAGQRLEKTKDAAQFINARLDPTFDRTGLVSFNELVTLDEPLTANIDQVSATIEGLRAAGQNDMSGGIDAGQQELRDNAISRKTMVFYTDADTDQDDRRDMLASANRAKREGTEIFTVGFEPVGIAAEYTLRRVASSEGHFFKIDAVGNVGTLVDMLRVLSCFCGNGIVDSPREECDDGNTNNDDACNNACLLTNTDCGDDVLDPGEQCDDGNRADGDGCSANCIAECYDTDWGIDIDRGGDLFSDLFSDESPVQDFCPGDTSLMEYYCGPKCDALGENVMTQDDRTVRQRSIEISCWDYGFAACDFGTPAACITGSTAPLRCSLSCGNGFLDPGEQCDDGNIASDDGCSTLCARETCGNGRLDWPEQCDDGKTCEWGTSCSTDADCPGGGSGLPEGTFCKQRNGDACKNDCTPNVCGDGALFYYYQTEQCDDGNLAAGDGCSPTCTLEPCGVPSYAGNLCARCPEPVTEDGQTFSWYCDQPDSLTCGGTCR